MSRQQDINEKMRAILIDWLVEVHMKFRLVPESLFLCVQIIDRYCNVADVPRSKLQLVGVTALFVACKHEEIYPPEVRDCVYITDRAYDRQEVLDMEQTILSVLNWKVSLPTAYPFLDRFLSLTKASPMTRHAAGYYLERTLQEHDLLKYRPSLVCASAVILALNNPDIRVVEEEYERQLPGLVSDILVYISFGYIHCSLLTHFLIISPSTA
jgi:cyclin B